MINEQRIYDNSPILVQNLLATVKGWQLNRQRKSGNYYRYAAEIAERHAWSSERIEQYAAGELRRLLGFAASNVPHYRELFARLGLDSADCCSLDFLQQLPVLDRSEVKRDPARFWSTDASAHHVSMNTTGTTGSPLAIVADHDARQKNYAYFDDFLRMVGIDPQAKHAVIGGRPLIPPRQDRPPYWRHSLAQNALLVSSYHITAESIAGYVKALSAFRPVYIESYPSALYLIARTARQRGIGQSWNGLEGIITSAEKLHEHQRTLVEEFFQAPLFDQYGNAEMSCLIHQCRRGAYHLRVDYGLLELLDDEGEPVPPGTAGSMVCTGLVNFQMPLIRYRIGDSAVLSSAHCDCGLDTPIVQEILGREDDTLIGADGRIVGRMSPVLKGMPIYESQYVQHVPGEVIVRVVPDRDFAPECDVRRIEELVLRRLGAGTRVIVQIVERVEYGKGQKLRNVISTVGKRDPA